VGIRFPAEATHFLRPEGPDRLSDHPASHIISTAFSPRVKRPGVTLRTHPHPVERMWIGLRGVPTFCSPYTFVAVISETDKIYSLTIRRKIPSSSFHYVMDKLLLSLRRNCLTSSQFLHLPWILARTQNILDFKLSPSSGCCRATPWRLNFMCRRFGTHCSIFVGGVSYEDGTVCSETWTHKIQTPENHPKERIQTPNMFHYIFGRSLSSPRQKAGRRVALDYASVCVCNFFVSIYNCPLYLLCCLLLDAWQETENKIYVLYRVGICSNYTVQLHYVSLLSVCSKGWSKQGGVAITETDKRTVTWWHLNESVSVNLPHFFRVSCPSRLLILFVKINVWGVWQQNFIAF
jgi:hypothetical protein